MDNNKGKIEEVVETGIGTALKEVHTMLPGVVQSFDPATQRADIQITIQRKISGKLVDVPLLDGVPVRFMQSGGFAITNKVQKGDHMMVFFAERCTDSWLFNGGIQPAGSTRRHSYSDAYAVPWIYPQTQVLPAFNNSGLEMRNVAGSVKITISDSGINIAGKLTVDGDVDITGDIDASGDMTAVGEVTGKLVKLSTHPHLAGTLLDSNGKAVTGATAAPTPGV